MGAEVVTQPDDSAVAGNEPALSRDDVLARYRHLRQVSKSHIPELMRFISQDALLEHARRLGLARGKTFALNEEGEMTFIFDLAIYTAPVGRTRAIDRYARSTRLAPESDEAVVLEAMRNARFSIFGVERRHEVAGLVLRDLLRETEVWLVDIAMEESIPDETVLAMRVYTPGRFSVTAAINLPVDKVLLDRALAEVPQLRRKPPAELADDRRFAEAVYRVALASGIMQQIVQRDPLAEAG